MIFNIIIIIISINACFIFKNSYEQICDTYITCFIKDPLLKINKTYCNPNSHRHLTLHLNTIIDMENLFLNNIETVDKLTNTLYNDSFTLFFIDIKNASYPRRKNFQINNQWLKNLFGRYKSVYSILIVRMVFRHLPSINITEVDLTEFVQPGTFIWLQFNLTNTFCSIKITADQYQDDLYVCINARKPTTTTTRSMYDVLSIFCFKIRKYSPTVYLKLDYHLSQFIVEKL